MKIIEITISTDGNVKMQTTGFNGQSCVDKTRWLKDAIGKETSIKLTADYFLYDSEKVEVKNSGN